MSRVAYITHIGTAVPQYKVAQSQAAQFMTRTVAREPETSRKVQVLYRATRIKERYSVLEDYNSQNGFSFFPNDKDLEPFPSTAKRMEKYREEACPLGIAAVADLGPSKLLEGVTHLVTVSCTGMYAPGLDIDLVKALGLATNVERTCINFMGCYAAFNALKMADATVRANPGSKVLIVSVELCSLHFQKDIDHDQLLANSLFADGAAAVLVESEPGPGMSLALEAFHCELIPEGEEDMAWTIMDTGFEMRLSAYVPNLLGGAAAQAVNQLKTSLGVKPEKIEHFALHPGGRRILEALESALDIDPEKNEAAYEVLANYGNMSSATVLFVLKSMLHRTRPEHHDDYLLSMAFGPGLTLESALMRVISAWSETK